jgi:hypothetical protein
VLAHAQIRGQAPDLQPAGLTVDKDCRIVVSISNNGPGLVPNAAYTLPGGSGVQMWIGSAAWGGIALGALDPTKLSQPAGGTVSYTWFPGLALPPGSHAVRVEVDDSNTIVENNEANNSLTTKLTCQQELPDLEPVDLSLDGDCRIDVTFRNNGPADVPESGYAHPGGGNLQMYMDGAAFGGIALGAADPVPHLSQPVGGTKVYKWFSSLPLPLGSHTVKLYVDMANRIAEANESNNTIEKVLTCQRRLPDLVPTNITVQPTGPFVNSPCLVYVTAMNIGTAALPDSAYAHVATAPSLQMWRNGAGWGGTILVLFDPTKGLQPAGATFTSTWMSPAPNMFLPPGLHTLQIDVDSDDALTELNEANNSLTKTVRCGVEILPPLP